VTAYSLYIGNPSDHIRALREKTTIGSEPSLQNALELAKNHLSHVPKHGTREIVVIYACLTTCDPGNVFETINLLKMEKIRSSAIGLAAELHVYKKLTKETGGMFGVVLNEGHFKELLFDHVSPPAIGADVSESSLVPMGFPSRKRQQVPTICSCHHKMVKGGYICPRCASKVCELPTECPVCQLTLVSSPHLARSYHHLFPVENFKELPPVQSINEESLAKCLSCQTIFDPLESRYSCPKCSSEYCLDCDVFIHEVLHNCIGCHLVLDK